MEAVEGTTVVGWVVSGVAFWWTAFLLVRGVFFPKRSYDFCNRAVSTAHAVAAVSLACLSVADWSCPVCPLASASSPRQYTNTHTSYVVFLIAVAGAVVMKALAVTVSYMVYDAACCYLNDDVRVDNTVHHLVSIVGIAAGLAYRRCGTEMVASLFVTEISSPLLHLREILKEFGVKDTDLNLLVDILFAVIFSVARMGFGPYLTYVTVTADNPILIKAMATGLQLVSAYWFLRILRMVRYKLGKKKPAPKVADN
uniref:TLC domain-containing protein n=1 Tax=Oryza punctata TaxID=4537 RepID=A0A0E0JGP2_ORYPU